MCVFSKSASRAFLIYMYFFYSALAMLQKSAKTVSTENCRKESAHKVAKTKRYKDTFKASFKDFNIPTEFWEQATQDRTK